MTTTACLDPNDIAALLQARLDPVSRAVLEQHVSECVDCRELLSAVVRCDTGLSPDAASDDEPDPERDDVAFWATLPFGERPLELAPGARLGRYVVVSQLGAGAMGEVYVAHDPELDRKIALKILRSYELARGERQRLQDRLWQEAQAMAQLAHPNVVAVHDVGTVDDHIFIAMELVEGQTLAAWLTAAPRGWRAVVEVFVAAGRGLAAAHSAGMVHRDFKPENVLVGDDGRVRVGDFGLARMLVAKDAALAIESLAADDSSLRSTMTALAGTPYYMAPEQFLRRPADARSDQFSFCVALYLAIAHRHPFAGERGDELVESVIRGRMRPPPRRKLAPRWLLRVVRRGLASDPGDRYPSMDALLAQLSADPRRRVRTAIVAVVLVALVADGAFVAFGGGESRQLCSGAEQKWVGIWDAPRARAVQQAFSTTGKPYASAAYNEVSRGLAAYRSGWIAMHTEACEATRVRGDQAEDLLERRMLCLDARLRDARALIDRFTTADAATVERAPLAIGALGDFAPCADAQVLSSELPPPADPATRARVSELRGELAALKAENPTGGARDRMAALVAATAATHYLPLEAEARLEQGVVETAAGDADAAAAAYEQAVWAAEAGRADEIAASAWTGLMESRRAQARNEDALALAPRVTALLARFGGNDEIEGALHTVRASILSDLNRVDEAQAEAERARSVLERRFGAGDLRVAEAFHALAGVAAMAGHQDDARAYYERELAIKRQVFGDDHPAVASVLIDLSFQQSMKGNYLDALATLARARAVYERAVAPEHPALARVAHKLGINYAALGQFDKAVAEFRRAVAIGEVAYGKEHPTYASSVMSLGDALEGLGRYDEALALLHQALSIFERRFGFVHGRVATCLELIARALVAKGRLRDGRAAELRAIELYEQVFGATTTQLRQPLLALGDIDNELGAPARAVAPLERALALGPDTDPAVYAEVQWCLGRALVDSHLDVTRGLALVRTARAQFEKEDRTRAALNAVDTWLRQRGARKVSPARAGGSL